MLDIQNVTVRFGDYSALDALTMKIPSGQIFGLLGPNGAGKSTLIRCLTGLQKINSGHIRLFDNQKPGSAATNVRIGYMPQQIAVYEQMTVRENLRFYAGLYSVEAKLFRQREEQLLTMTELTDKADTLLHTLSGGMKRRAMLATTLVHNPELLILDEPTAGVDPLLRLKFWKWFRQLRDQGTSILITTHHLNEAEQCDDIGFLRRGNLIGRGAPQALIEMHQQKDLEAVFIQLAQALEGNE